jgi:hypothetical protein
MRLVVQSSTRPERIISALVARAPVEAVILKNSLRAVTIVKGESNAHN